MERFENNQKVRVSDAKSDLFGMTGAVVRLRMQDEGAWVRFAEELPDNLRAFPATTKYGEPEKRRNDKLVYPDECEVA